MGKETILDERGGKGDGEKPRIIKETKTPLKRRVRKETGVSAQELGQEEAEVLSRTSKDGEQFLSPRAPEPLSDGDLLFDIASSDQTDPKETGPKMFWLVASKTMPQH